MDVIKNNAEQLGGITVHLPNFLDGRLDHSASGGLRSHQGQNPLNIKVTSRRAMGENSLRIRTEALILKIGRGAAVPAAKPNYTKVILSAAALSKLGMCENRK